MYHRSNIDPNTSQGSLDPAIMAAETNSKSAANSCSDASVVDHWGGLSRSLNSIKSYGDFAAMERYQLAPTPIFRVGDEIIRAPLNDRDVESIKKMAQQAPFGNGNQTIVDTTVRNTWELGFDQICLMNPAWQSFLGTALTAVCTKMGIVGPVEVLPHKLLLYERGSFFKAHKDSQKAEGMIATLVVCLPSEHEGGEVHLSHAGQHRTFSTSESSLFDTTALAWFSDVTHEVRNIVSGHRLVLTYNIITKSGAEISAAILDGQRSEVDRALTQCRLHYPDFSRRIYVLEHKYSRAGLSLSGMKGRDRAVCDILYKLCSSHGFYLLFGHLTREEYRDVDDDQDTEITLSIDSIVGPDGKELAKEIQFSEGQLLHNPYYTDRDEDGFEGSKHLGNEESPEIFKYYDTAAIICRKNHLATYLHNDLRYNTNVFNIMRMVMKDHDDNPDAMGAPGDSLAILERIFYFDGSKFTMALHVYPEMAEWAWKHKYHTLYRYSIFAALRDARPQNTLKIVAKIMGTDISDTGDRVDLQWGEYFCGAIASITDLVKLDNILSVVGDAITDSLKPAFNEWRTATEQDKFNSRKSLEWRDMPFIVSRLGDLDWVTNSLIPALSARGERELIVSLVEHLSGGESPMTETTPLHDIASKILQSTYPKLALVPTRFNRSDQRFTFIDILKSSLSLGLKSTAIQLLDLSWMNIDACHKDADSFPLKAHSTVIGEFLRRLGHLLRDYKIEHVDSTRQLFILLIRRYMYFLPPSYPENRAGWSFKPRGCGCKPCQELDDFLRAEDTSEYETQIERSDASTKYHLLSRLPHGIFGNAYDEITSTLKVWKIEGKELESDLKDYNTKVAGFEDPFHLLRFEYLKELLGDALYRELIMLEGVKNSKGSMQLASAVVATETKRVADEVFNG